MEDFKKLFAKVMGGFFFAMALMLLLINAHLVYTTQPATGTVINEEGDTYYRVSFTTVTQQKVEPLILLNSRHGAKYISGEQVNLRYPPQAPENASENVIPLWIRFGYPTVMLLLAMGVFFKFDD